MLLCDWQATALVYADPVAFNELTEPLEETELPSLLTERAQRGSRPTRATAARTPTTRRATAKKATKKKTTKTTARADTAAASPTAHQTAADTEIQAAQLKAW
jgi:topoisomerase IA-like protein